MSADIYRHFAKGTDFAQKTYLLSCDLRFSAEIKKLSSCYQSPSNLCLGFLSSACMFVHGAIESGFSIFRAKKEAADVLHTAQKTNPCTFQCFPLIGEARSRRSQVFCCTKNRKSAFDRALHERAGRTQKSETRDSKGLVSAAQVFNFS